LDTASQAVERRHRIRVERELPRVLEKSPIATIDQMLQGTSPGVQVTTASSEPGGAISIRIRGASSITGNSEPLYVIDGFPIENDISRLSGW
jgi:hypothetical protein